MGSGKGGTPRLGGFGTAILLSACAFHTHSRTPLPSLGVPDSRQQLLALLRPSLGVPPVPDPMLFVRRAPLPPLRGDSKFLDSNFGKSSLNPPEITQILEI